MMDQMGQASGGWEFHSDQFLTWLNGYSIICPRCGNGSGDAVKKKGDEASKICAFAETAGKPSASTRGARTGSTL